ncbi:MAG: spore coat protein GerQ [bacterium]|nr:spore coat protein GerQ [bacterium]
MNNNYYYRETSYNPSTSNYPTFDNNLYENPIYASNIINSAKGKKVKIYMSFPDSIEWRDKIFEGTIDSSGPDYILITNKDNIPTLLQKIYINFIEFESALK